MSRIRILQSDTMAFQHVVYRYRSQVGSRFAEAPSNKSEAFLVYSFGYAKERDFITDSNTTIIMAFI